MNTPTPPDQSTITLPLTPIPIYHLQTFVTFKLDLAPWKHIIIHSGPAFCFTRLQHRAPPQPNLPVFSDIQNSHTNVGQREC